MEEKTFLSEGNVTVTNTRFIIDSQTFAMSGITSVKAEEKKPSRVGPLVFLGLGFLSAFGGKETWGLTVFLIVIGGLWWVLQKSEFNVVVQSASGENKPFKSKDRDRVIKIVSALNDSIIHRG